MRRLLPLLLAVCCSLLAGCAGYKVGPIKPKRFETINTIAVPTFKNDTLEPRLEVLMTNTLIKQIQQDGTYKVVDEKDADAILECTLTELDRRPARSVDGNVLLAKEYVLTMRARYRLYLRGSGQVVEQRTAMGTSAFFVSGSSVLTADVNQDQRQAIPLATEDLAVRLTSQISEGW